MTSQPHRPPPSRVATLPAPPAGPPVTRGEWATLGIILLAALLLRASHLADSLWYDEILYTGTQFDDPAGRHFILWHAAHPPLYPLLLMAWTAVFGNSEIAVRIPALCFGLGSLVLTWLIGRSWVGSREALLATAFLAVCPPHIWYSHENKINIALLFFSTAAVWLYHRAVERGRGRDWILATLFIVAAVWSHAYGTWVAASVFCWLALRVRRERAGILRPALLSAAALLAAWLPLAWLKLSQLKSIDRLHLRPFNPLELYRLLLVWLPHGNILRTLDPRGPWLNLLRHPWPDLFLDFFFALLLVLGLVRTVYAARSRDDARPVPAPRTAALLLIWLALPLALTMAASLLQPHFYTERNMLIILPPFALLLAIGALSFKGRLPRAAAATLLLALPAFAAFMLHTGRVEPWGVFTPQTDWRSAAVYLQGEVARDGPILALTTTPGTELAYYGPRLIEPGLPPLDRPRVVHRNFCWVGARRTERVIRRGGFAFCYVIRNRLWPGCADELDAFIAARNSKLLETREFAQLTIRKYALSALPARNDGNQDDARSDP